MLKYLWRKPSKYNICKIFEKTEEYLQSLKFMQKADFLKNLRILLKYLKIYQNLTEKRMKIATLCMRYLQNFTLNH